MLFSIGLCLGLMHGSFKPFGVFRYIRDYAVVACSHFGKRDKCIYEFDERLKTLVFFIAYLWTTMLGYALGFMINNWFSSSTDDFNCRRMDLPEFLVVNDSCK